MPSHTRRSRVLAFHSALLFCILVWLLPARASAQLPTADQAQQLLRTQPGLVSELRRRIGESGLTPDQVRARLRAMGYPENLLDSYLQGADTTQTPMPNQGVLDAIGALGIVSMQGADSLQQLRDSLAGRRADTLAADTLRRKKGLQRFGLEAFQRVSSAFQAPETGPVDENYRLGPGDVLVLILSGDVENAYTLEVTREGFVFIPQVGTVYVANLTLGQLNDLLYQRLGKVYSGVRRGASATTHFQVSVASLRNIQVYVVGDVIQPGSYQVSAAGTPLTALYAAAGPTEQGSLRRILVRHGSTIVDSVDAYDYLLHGDLGTQARLQTGDVVFVPVHGPLVKITGAVIRPAVYEMKTGETLRDAIADAGGFDPEAIQRRVQIHRILPSGAGEPQGTRVVIDVGPDQFTGGAVPAVPMEAGDSIVVFKVPARVRSYVTVLGDVWTPGVVGYREGMRLSDALRLAGGPRPDVYLDRILVSRVRADSSRVQLRSAFRDSTGSLTQDIVLQQEDEITVFGRGNFRPERYVSVVGAVRQQGRVAYREGMTLRDAVLLAGGVTQDADLRQAQIARVPDDRKPGTLARTIEAPLDSTYLVERTAEGYGGPPGIPTRASGAPEVMLQPYDNVLITRQTGWALPRLVTLTGEVRHPGRYALLSKTERLRDLVERAGGLTDQAYAGGIEFYRVTGVLLHPAADSDSVAQDTSDTTMPKPATMTGKPDSVLTAPMVLRERVGIDLPRVLKDADAKDNVILADGDSISIPEYSNIVVVDGEVNSPGPVAWEPGRSADWYVSRAGGYAEHADRKRTYVVQPDGKKDAVKRRWLLADHVPHLGAGGQVYVPRRTAAEQQGTSIATILSAGAQVLATVVTLIVVSKR